MSNRSSRPLIFGEVLFDRFADGSVVLGGAPFNVAWHLQAFGLSPLFISRVGDDPLGRQVKSAMLGWGMETSCLGLDSAHPTGTVDVTLHQGEPRYDICRERAYDFIDADSLPPLPVGGLLYHGTLALRNDASLQALERIKQNGSTRVFVDINLRSPWWDRDRVHQVLCGARWLKLNEEELARIEPEGRDTKERVHNLMTGYAFDLLVVTKGEKGAQAVSSEGGGFHVAPGRTVSVADTVGAGDAFSAVLLLGHAKGWPLSSTLERAQAFAGAVVGIRGATTREEAFYRNFTHEWGLTE